MNLYEELLGQDNEDDLRPKKLQGKRESEFDELDIADKGLDRVYIPNVRKGSLDSSRKVATTLKQLNESLALNKKSFAKYRSTFSGSDAALRDAYFLFKTLYALAKTNRSILSNLEGLEVVPSNSSKEGLRKLLKEAEERLVDARETYKRSGEAEDKADYSDAGDEVKDLREKLERFDTQPAKKPAAKKVSRKKVRR